jgi:hypothetical protein
MSLLCNSTKNKFDSVEERTTPIGLVRYAYEYLDAALLVEERSTDKNPGSQIPPMPAYFLAFHGIELTLKSFLLSKEVTLDDLSGPKFGHGLSSCYRRAKGLGLSEIFTEHSRDIAALEMLEDLNGKQGLRYIRTGAKSFPLWSIVEPFAIRLHQAVATRVGYHSFNSSYPNYK